MQGMIRQLEGELQKVRVPTKDVVEQAMKQIEVEKPPAFPKWELSLDAMYMDLKGLDWQALDVVRYTTINRTSTGTSSNKNLDINSRPTFRGELGYRLNNKWRIGASGWFFDEEDKTSGTLTTTTASTPPYSSTSYTTYYRAKQEFDIWNLDLFATRNIVNGERGFFDMNLGAKIASPNHKMSLAQNLYDSYYYNASSFGEDFTSLSSEHEAHYSLLAGPSIGLQGRFDVWGPVRFEGFMNQSALMGKVHQRGNLHAVQDVYRQGNFQYRSTGDLPFRTAKSVFIPVTELKAKLIFDITKNVAFDVGGFFSQWWDMPVAPELSKPWEFTQFSGLALADGLNWEERERTLRFVGATFGFSLRH